MCAGAISHARIARLVFAARLGPQGRRRCPWPPLLRPTTTCHWRPAVGSGPLSGESARRCCRGFSSGAAAKLGDRGGSCPCLCGGGMIEGGSAAGRRRSAVEPAGWEGVAIVTGRGNGAGGGLCKLASRPEGARVVVNDLGGARDGIPDLSPQARLQTVVAAIEHAERRKNGCQQRRRRLHRGFGGEAIFRERRGWTLSGRSRHPGQQRQASCATKPSPTPPEADWDAVVKVPPQGRLLRSPQYDLDVGAG